MAGAVGVSGVEGGGDGVVAVGGETGVPATGVGAEGDDFDDPHAAKVSASTPHAT